MKRLGLVIDGMDHFIKPMLPVLHEKYQVQTFKPHFAHLPVIGRKINDFLLDQQLQAFIKQNDVVFFEWAGYLLNKATRLSTVGKIVTRLHSVELATAAHLIDWSKVDIAIVVSEKMRERLLGVASTSPRALRVVNNGVDLQKYCMAERTFAYRLGMVCSVLPIKRVYEAILCLYELRRQGYPFELQVVGKTDAGGEPRYYLAIKELVARHGLGKAVHFLGYQELVSKYYQQIDIFLSNSYWEGQQSALLEAMASGCYSLSHCWGGVEEVLPTEQIYVTDAELRAKLLAYATLPESEKVVTQQRMRSIAETKFDFQRMVEQFSDIIEGV